MTYDLFGFGNALVDFEISVNEEELSKLEVKKGLMTLVEQERQKYLLQHVKGSIKKKSCGGSAANTIITAQQLGLSTYYACKVADDETGRFFYEDIKSHKVDCTFDHMPLPEGETGKCMILITPDAERSMETYLGITQTVSEEQVHFDSLEKSGMFFIEGYLVAAPDAQKAAVKARNFCLEKKIPVALTFSDPGMVSIFKEQVLEIIGKEPLDLIFANELEALTFANTKDLATAVENLKTYAKNFVVTRSEKGAIVYDGKELQEVAGFTVNAVDATGAGDVFAGAFIAATKKGKSAVEATKLANFAASKIVSKYGARLDPEQIAEIRDFYQSLS